MNFTKKVALITGGAQGIGRAYAHALLNIGMKVCICDIKESAAKEFMLTVPAYQKDNVIFQNCNVSSYTDFKEAFDKAISVFGRIDMLINNAAICNEQDWRKMIEVNLVGLIIGTKLAFEYMGINRGGNGGHIINTASVSGLRSFMLAPVYCGTKHAVVGLTKSYGTDYYFQRTGITVNAICPGAVDTDMFKTFPDLTLDKAEAEKFLANKLPMRPEDIGKSLIQLLKDGKNGALLKIESIEMEYV